MKIIIIKSFNGIGDLLFVTPTLKKIKEVYPNSSIIVNTNYPELLKNNPYVNVVGRANEGVFLGYSDPIHGKNPVFHHIQSDYKIVRNHYKLDNLPLFLENHELIPSIFFGKSVKKTNKIGVQVRHKGHWHRKKVWPYFKELCNYDRNLFKPIVLQSSVFDLVKKIASYKAVVCAEGGISHIAKAVGTQAIVVYGGFAHPEWNGYESQINVTNKLSCSYCYNSKPCVSDVKNKCMYEIPVSRILKYVEGLDKISMLERGNAKQFVEATAFDYCKGKGIDIGCGKWPLKGTIPIDLTLGHDADKLNFDSDSLDYVFSSHLLEHVENIFNVLKEMKRVLKPGGILFLYLPHPNYQPWRKKNLKWHLHDLYPWKIRKILKVMDLKELYSNDEDTFFGHIHVYKKPS